MDRRVGDRVSVCFLLLRTLSQVLCQQCRGPCSCPLSVPRCPEGVPLVLDGCCCCQVFARQLGEAFSNMHVCDSQRGLQWKDELGCELNVVTYQDGQVFRPSCALQCTGGGMTCVRLCSDELRLPSPNCPNPRHVQLPDVGLVQAQLPDGGSGEAGAAGLFERAQVQAQVLWPLLRRALALPLPRPHCPGGLLVSLGGPATLPGYGDRVLLLPLQLPQSVHPISVSRDPTRPF
ncbi:hypothetical protein SKAU_G00157750 [Synaphobranchus kaupii]|uniref:IGFBP N-terminal domain-containing protein n=1 Tax=Synaphobranchus kaupii TaxID=118154 RepID=A0A9Q1IZF7_SYNKA|nr:hypothetical protein SKAU_G00157750 [Synaphobranchus kaupii]